MTNILSFNSLEIQWLEMSTLKTFDKTILLLFIVN